MLSYNKYDFYDLNKKILSIDITDALDNLIIDKNINSNFEIQNICSIENINRNSAIFVNFDKDITIQEDNILVITNNEKFINKYKNYVLVKDLNKSFKALADYIYLHDDSLNYKDEFNLINNSSISKLSKIDPSVKIGRNCVIGKGVVIGKNSIIKNNVIIKNSIIRNNTIISDNSTI